MVVIEVTPQQILSACRQTLGLPVTDDASIEDHLLASLVRRMAGFACPCSRATLRSGILESLRGLTDDEVALADRIDAVVEGLIVGGDLLELNDVATFDLDAKNTWVFSAPPSYIIRPSGSIFLTGIVPDHDTYLPQRIASRITYDGLVRVIEPRDGEILRDELQEQGLQEISEGAWLRSPKQTTARELLESMERTLYSTSPAGTVSDLQILDATKSVKFYRGRWVIPSKSHSGSFVARRPQDYGASIWCLVHLDGGVPVKILDLPLPRAKWRGCDAAWHLQAAIDACRSVPQVYRRSPDEGGVRFDFFSPLPQWAQRRLMIFGRARSIKGTLFSYLLPAKEAETEEKYLQECLWLKRTDDSI